MVRIGVLTLALALTQALALALGLALALTLTLTLTRWRRITGRSGVQSRQQMAMVVRGARAGARACGAWATLTLTPTPTPTPTLPLSLPLPLPLTPTSEGVWCAGDASKFCIPGTLEAVGGVHFLPSCYMDDVSTHELSAS